MDLETSSAASANGFSSENGAAAADSTLQRENAQANIQPAPLPEFALAAIKDKLASGTLSVHECKKHGIPLDTEGLVLATAPYLNYEHRFVRIDPESYYHERMSRQVKGHLYGACIKCGKTFDQLRMEPDQDAVPSLFWCSSYEPPKVWNGKQKQTNTVQKPITTNHFLAGKPRPREE